jgi:CheY-like chemotaxis protein/GAF domain-containing protein
MTAPRLRLVLLKGTPLPDDPGVFTTLPSAFEVVEVENVETARQMLEDAPRGSVMLSTEVLAGMLGEGDLPTAAALQHVGEGVGVVDSEGSLVWASGRLQDTEEPVREHFIRCCGEAIERCRSQPSTPPGRSRGDRFSFRIGDDDFDLVVSPSAFESDGDTVRATAVVGVLWNATSSRALQRKIDAIDAAGSELMRIEAASIRRLDMADRLRLLEERIVGAVHELLEFDNFEIRLLDRHTNRLELVVAVGLTPLRIGEVIFAEPEGNGISGHVAATGRSYICTDVQHDPIYREGLDNAGSSLTVPLQLHDEVIGVFNIESNSTAAFDDNDRQFAEIFGRYVAMAMHILDLLVVERYTTNEQVSANVLSELTVPIDEITSITEALCENGVHEPEVRADLERLRSAVSDIRSRIAECTSGPQTILGAEEELRRLEPDPTMSGRRVLVADNEPEILHTLQKMLTQKGCLVTACGSGIDTIEAIQTATAAGISYELIVSDIKLGDRNGYEIFRAAKAADEQTPVILMTGFGYDPHHSIIRASQEGLHSLLFKPFKATQLLEAMTRAFQPATP